MSQKNRRRFLKNERKVTVQSNIPNRLSKIFRLDNKKHINRSDNQIGIKRYRGFRSRIGKNGCFVTTG